MRKTITLLPRKLPYACVFFKVYFVLLLTGLCTGITQGQASLQITEIFSGQEGADVTADWFEISNVGDAPWASGVDGDLHYDDESIDPLDATLVSGIGEISAGSAAIVVIGNEADAINFFNVWNPVTDLNGVAIGYTDGAGLGGGGDRVALWVGDPNAGVPVDTASYPDTAPFDGQSYDVSLGEFSTVGNANEAVSTIALGGSAGDVPNIASPGNQGPIDVDPNAPIVSVDLTTATPLLNLNADGPSYLSGVIGDPTDPASTVGIPMLIVDKDSPIGDIIMTVQSDNQDVVPDGNLVITGSEGERTLTITPVGSGYATITVTATDPDLKTGTYIFYYGGSRQALNPETTRFHTGAADGSTAITVGDDLLWVADDEDQIIRLYDKNHSGYPVNMVDLSPDVGDDEIDIEGSYRIGDTIYWIGSHLETARSVAFSTIESGDGDETTLTFIAQYTTMRAELMAWDDNDGHGLGAGYYGLSSGFEIEGLAIDPSNPAGALLGVRAPLRDGNAIIIPVNNFQEITTAAVAPGTAVFGAPFDLDLERHSVRSFECNAHGCLIVAGPFRNINDFRLFTWTGNPLDTPELRAAVLNSGMMGNYEGIAGIPDQAFLGSAGDTLAVQLVVDMGTFDFYGDGSEAKALPNGEWKKFGTEWIVLGEVQTPPIAFEGDIVITEVMQNPGTVNDEFGEWFEIYNNTFASIDLNGWVISDMDIDIDTIDNGGPLVIDPGAYMVFGPNADGQVNGGVAVDYVFSNMFLGNGADELIIRAPDGVVIDSIAWDGGTSWPDPTGASMSLLAPNLNNNDALNWCVAMTAYGDGDLGTPGMANDCPPPPAANLQITEAWVGHVTGGDLTEDWFEITNFGNVAWTAGVDPDLYYDDESQDPAIADLINGITEILPGKSVVVTIGSEADAMNFRNVWSPDYRLDNVEIGWTDGAGLGQGGDGVTLFLGIPSVETIVDFESFGEVPSGVSWDVVLQAFSEQGVGEPQTGSHVAVATTQTNDSGESSIGSPGNEGPVNVQEFDLQITEIFSGQDGTDLTVDWFEIKNAGSAPWNAGTNGQLYYDDESQDPAEATVISGIQEILPGQTAVVLITGQPADVLTFTDVWSPVIDLNGVPIGITDGAGLGAGGDLVAIWVGDPNASTPVDTASYPDTGADDGKSYDITLSAFSEVGNANGAVATIAFGGDNNDVPNIGSPGDGRAVPQSGLIITEIFSGQAGADLTADWFEIINTSDEGWVGGVSAPLFYDDESLDPAEASIIEGISAILPGGSAIVVIGSPSDASEFINVWSPVINLTGIPVGYTDGAGLGAGGDLVALWVGDPHAFVPADTASYPDTDTFDGQSYDVDLSVFSVVGNTNGAVATIALGGDNSDVPNIGSPGNQGPVSVKNLQDISALVSVFPNPGSGIFHVKAEEAGAIESITVYDVMGKVVQSSEHPDTHAVVDITHLTEGLYTMYIKFESAFATHRLIKQ